MDTQDNNEFPVLEKQKTVVEDLREERQAIRRTKIVCTMGPGCQDPEILQEMIESGMDVARLNLAHGNEEWHRETIQKVRSSAEAAGKQVGIMLDTEGPDVRTGYLEGHTPVQLEKGQTLRITNDYSFLGNKDKISCSFPDFSKVPSGTKVLMADGNIICVVEEVLEGELVCRVDVAGELNELRNLAVLGVKLDLPTLTETDVSMLKSLAVSMDVDFIGVSFTRSSDDIEKVRRLLGRKGYNIKMVAKIEDIEGINNLHEIVPNSDAVMVARGDLGMVLPNEKMFLAQKYIIQVSNHYAKPVITSTQMLESMVVNPRPTRAEASDAANAVIDGSDALMLSVETAMGKHPVKAVQFLNKICIEAEEFVVSEELQEDREYVAGTREGACEAAATAARERSAAFLLVVSERGGTARLVEKYMPPAPIYVITANKKTYVQLSLERNCFGVFVEKYSQPRPLVKKAINDLKEKGLAQTGDLVVALHGHNQYAVNKADVMSILTVE